MVSNSWVFTFNFPFELQILQHTTNQIKHFNIAVLFSIHSVSIPSAISYFSWCLFPGLSAPSPCCMMKVMNVWIKEEERLQRLLVADHRTTPCLTQTRLQMWGGAALSPWRMDGSGLNGNSSTLWRETGSAPLTWFYDSRRWEWFERPK